MARMLAILWSSTIFVNTVLILSGSSPDWARTIAIAIFTTVTYIVMEYTDEVKPSSSPRKR